MKLISPKFENGEEVPRRYTCEGPNISPPLEWQELPAGTKSLVLTMEDPDAPAKPWVHWLIFNIPPTTLKAEEGTLPDGGTEGLANGGTYGYEGPCPPSGEHRYVFTLYALHTVLTVDNQANRQEVIKAMEGFILEKAELTGIYRLKDQKNSPLI